MNVMKRILNFKAIITVLIGAAYVAPLIWALNHDKIDVNSYLAGVGPMFGLVLNFWFKGDSNG